MKLVRVCPVTGHVMAEDAAGGITVPEEVRFKTAQEKADAVSAFINSAGLTGGRATFMAGFTYYSVGRYMFACCESKAYFAFNIAALVFSIITAGTCQIYVYYAQRLADPELQYEFCIQALGYSRSFSRTNLMATFLYAIGIGLLPWAYYQPSNMKWCPLVLMIIISIAYYPALWKIVKSQLKLQNYSEQLFDHIDDKKLVEESEYGNKNRSESLQDFLLKQSNIVSGRSIFISGLAQQGIMRFMPTPVVFKDSDHGANMFLVMVSFAMAFSYFSSNVFLLFQVFIPDTVKIKQLAFAIMIKPLANKMFVCYISGFFALFLGNMFVADGCNFEEMRRISIFFGFLGLALLVFCTYKSAATDAAAVNKAHDDIVSKPGVAADSNSSNEEKKVQLDNILLALNTAGSMSTFAAGYLFYNVITYDSDVLRLPDNENIDWIIRCNLIANFTTVTIALYASVTDTVLSLNANHYNSVHDKLQYFQSRIWIVQSVIYGYYFSLVGWFVCFGFFGFVKYNRISYIPFCYATVGVVVMILGTLYVHHARKSIDMVNPRVRASRILTTEEINVSISRPANLTSLGFSVIFLGGFAYFGINFFQFYDRPFELTYMHAMCLCFTTSMWVMVFGDRYNYQISKCPTVAAKLSFSESTYPFYCMTVVLAYVVVASLIVGFNFLGFIKYIENYEDVRREIQMSTTIIAFFCLPLVYWTLSTFKTAVFGTEKFNVSAAPGEINRFKNQVMAGLATSGFIAGNVCYEILFAEANSPLPWKNKFYFFMMSLAFSFGLSAIIVSTLILLCLGELTSRDRKEYFVVSLRRLKLGVFLLSMGCILCWQTSITALSGVKYTGDKGGDLQSLIPGLIGVLSILWYLYGVKSISDRIRAHGRVVTAEAIVHDDTKHGDIRIDESESVDTELKNDPSVILNPLAIKEKLSVASFQIENADDEER